MEEDAQALAEEYARFIKVDASNYVSFKSYHSSYVLSYLNFNFRILQR